MPLVSPALWPVPKCHAHVTSVSHCCLCPRAGEGHPTSDPMWHLVTCFDTCPLSQVQDQVRAELRQVLGPRGTPKPGDMGRLPLLRATVTETLRLRPPAPLALPHCARRHSRYSQ